MHRSRIVTLALVAALSLPLAGCFGLGEQSNGPTDLTDSLVDMAEDATEIARTLEGIEWGKTNRAVIRDAATGEQLAEITDQAQIDEIFSPLSQVNGIAPTPDAPEEYVVEIWQPSTVTLLDGKDEADEVEVVHLITYEGSDVVTLKVVPISLSVNLASESGVADAIRALV